MKMSRNSLAVPFLSFIYPRHRPSHSGKWKFIFGGILKPWNACLSFSAVGLVFRKIRIRLSRSCTLIVGELVFKTSMLKTSFVHFAFLFWTWWRCNRRHTIRAMLGWAVITFCRQIKSDTTFSSTNCTYQNVYVMHWVSVRHVQPTWHSSLHIFISPCSKGWSHRVDKNSFDLYILSLFQKLKVPGSVFSCKRE